MDRCLTAQFPFLCQTVIVVGVILMFIEIFCIEKKKKKVIRKTSLLISSQLYPFVRHDPSSDLELQRH